MLDIVDAIYQMVVRGLDPGAAGRRAGGGRLVTRLGLEEPPSAAALPPGQELAGRGSLPRVTLLISFLGGRWRLMIVGLHVWVGRSRADGRDGGGAGREREGPSSSGSSPGLGGKYVAQPQSPAPTASVPAGEHRGAPRGGEHP